MAVVPRGWPAEREAGRGKQFGLARKAPAFAYRRIGAGGVSPPSWRRTYPYRESVSTSAVSRHIVSIASSRRRARPRSYSRVPQGVGNRPKQSPANVQASIVHKTDRRGRRLVAHAPMRWKQAHPIVDNRPGHVAKLSSLRRRPLASASVLSRGANPRSRRYSAAAATASVVAGTSSAASRRASTHDITTLQKITMQNITTAIPSNGETDPMRVANDISPAPIRSSV